MVVETHELLRKIIEDKKKELEFLLLNSEGLVRSETELQKELETCTKLYEQYCRPEPKGKWCGCCYESELDAFFN